MCVLSTAKWKYSMRMLKCVQNTQVVATTYSEINKPSVSLKNLAWRILLIWTKGKALSVLNYEGSTVFVSCLKPKIFHLEISCLLQKGVPVHVSYFLVKNNLSEYLTQYCSYLFLQSLLLCHFLAGLHYNADFFPSLL